MKVCGLMLDPDGAAGLPGEGSHLPEGGDRFVPAGVEAGHTVVRVIGTGVPQVPGQDDWLSAAGRRSAVDA